MTIRDRIFEKLEELNMTQKEFSLRTGIPQTTVSDWRKKKTNPTAEKIMVICKNMVPGTFKKVLRYLPICLDKSLFHNYHEVITGYNRI